MLSVILLEPENEGNLGAVARVMANFDFNSLFLAEPKADHLSDCAIARSKHAKSVLKKAKIISKENIFKKFDCVIGTTAKIGSDYNIPRSPLTLDDLAKKLRSKINSNLNIGLLFGRESKGLSNSEIRKCDFVVRISSSKKYSTLNISHAVGIVLYMLFRYRNDEGKVEYAENNEKGILTELIHSVLNMLEFSTKDKKETQKKVWKRIMGKSFMTKREAFALIGLFKKIKTKLK